jgi:four helix bundle protein
LDRLDVYRVSLEFQGLAARLASRIRGEPRSQLDRASLSITLNVAEGAGRRSRADRQRFYSIARGSALECAAILDVLAARGQLALGDLRRGRAFVVRIVQMLTRLTRP